MQVVVVTVGDELLASDTANTNAAWLCEELMTRGVSVERMATVSDRIADITRVVNEYHAEYDAIVIIGGLGPTHDDVIMESVTAAFGRSLERNADAEEWLETSGGYSAADLVEGTIDPPAGSRMLSNDEGVTPGAVVGSVYVLPGVSGEMRVMFARVADGFAGEWTHVRFVHTSEPESSLIERFEAIQSAFDVIVGNYPGDHVRVELTGADEETVESAAAWLEARVDLYEEWGRPADGSALEVPEPPGGHEDTYEKHGRDRLRGR